MQDACPLSDVGPPRRDPRRSHRRRSAVGPTDPGSEEPRASCLRVDIACSEVQTVLQTGSVPPCSAMRSRGSAALALALASITLRSTQAGDTDHGANRPALKFGAGSALASDERGVGTKRGLVGGLCNHTELFEPHARNWQYNYLPSLSSRDAAWKIDPACREIAAEKSFEFVPMVSSLSQLPGAGSKLELINSRHLLGMNEPSDAKNESAALAASQWRQYEALAATASPPLLLGTPAPGGLNLARGQRWLEDFFSNCTACRVDFVAVHWYECDGSTEASAEKSAESMMSFLAAVWASFSKPIWLTEFNCGDGDPADNPLANQTKENHLRFMKAALPKLEAAEHVTRYSWFQMWQRNTPEHPGHNPGCSLTNTDGSTLSELGHYYSSYQLTPQ